MALNQNILIASNDYVRDGMILNPGSFQGGKFTGLNALNPNQWEFARLSGQAPVTTVVEIDLRRDRVIELAAVMKHNMGQLAKWRFRVANTRAALTAAPLYDSGWMESVPNDPLGVDQWGEFDWGGQEAYTSVQGYNQNLFHPLPEIKIGRYIRYDFDDSEAIYNRPLAPFIQFTRLWASSAYQPSFNIAYGAEIIPYDNTQIDESRSEVRLPSQLKVRGRGISATFENIPKNELLRNIFGPLFVREGKSGEVIGMLSPLEPATYAYEAIYGNLVDLAPVKLQIWKRGSTTINLREAV